jgi:hypothetical protein
MFGASLWGGEDVNASALGGAEQGAQQGQNYGQYSAAAYGDTGSGSSNQNTDPAEQAATQAYANAAGINQQTNNASAVAGGIGKAVGLFSSIEGLVGPRAKRLAKSQRVYSRHQAQFAVNQSIRARDQYKQDSAIQEQKLAQSYSGRGLGESSIHDEGMQYFKDTAARQAAQLDENVTMAQLGQRLVHSQISASYAQPWLSLGNSAANML